MSEEIERFKLSKDSTLESGPGIDGPYMRVSDHDNELRRWQDGIRDHLIKQFDVPADRIDGAGADSGDPLDFTLAEITQGIGYLIDDRPPLSAAISEVEKMRDSWRAWAKDEGDPMWVLHAKAASQIVDRLKSLSPAPVASDDDKCEHGVSLDRDCATCENGQIEIDTGAYQQQEGK